MCQVVFPYIFQCKYDVNVNCCSYGDHSHAISDSSVDDAIKKLKIGKSDGYDGLTSDYIINGTPLLTHYYRCYFL